MSFNIEVEGGSSVRLPTAGKYCDRDIIITALGGGGGSMEMGELTATIENYYDLTIPVSSKKTHLLILPKQYGALIADPTTGGYVERRICILLAVAGEGMTEISVLNQYNAGQGLNRGDCYHYSAIENSKGKATFNDTAITVKIAYSPFNPGEYYWFAW